MPLRPHRSTPYNENQRMSSLCDLLLGLSLHIHQKITVYDRHIANQQRLEFFNIIIWI